MSKYFPETKSSGGRLEVKLEFSNYATKTDAKNETGVDTSKFAKKVDLAYLKSSADKLDTDRIKDIPTNLSNLKSKVDKLDVDKSVLVPVDLSKLSDVVKNDVVKKDVYNAKIKNIKNQIPDITNLDTITSLNAKINESKGEIPDVTNLDTTAAFTTVKNKIPNVSNLGASHISILVCKAWGRGVSLMTFWNLKKLLTFKSHKLSWNVNEEIVWMMILQR